MLTTTIHDILALTSLAPSPRVNGLFTSLVNQIVTEPSSVHYDSFLCTAVQDVASRSETEMEKCWAHQIIASTTPQATLAKFPYCNNYAELVRREIELLEKSGLPLNGTSNVLMIGTGPLPMTALELMKQRHVAVDHVDISPQALRLCGMVGQRLGLACGHIEGDGATVKLNASYDVVIVAGLAGQTVSDKQSIIDNALTSLTDGGRILVRSSYGARELLYPAVTSDAFSGVKLLEEYHPTDDVINSVFIYEKE